MTAAELIKELKKLENINGENLLCLNVVFTNESGDNTVTEVEVAESYHCGESRKIRLKR